MRSWHLFQLINQLDPLIVRFVFVYTKYNIYVIWLTQTYDLISWVIFATIGIFDFILGCSKNTWEDEIDSGGFVEQFEAPVVDTDLVDFEEVAGHFSHGTNQVRHADQVYRFLYLLLSSLWLSIMIYRWNI